MDRRVGGRELVAKGVGVEWEETTKPRKQVKKEERKPQERQEKLAVNMSTKINNALPQDMEIDILSRLPVKSLVRFRSVCKTWPSLFKNPKFITKHDAYANTNLLIQHHDHENNCFFWLLSNDHEEESEDGGRQMLSVKEQCKPSLCRPDVLGPCNGLLCFSTYKGDVALWNPATREFKLLPPSSVEGDASYSCLGFGFDSNANDYKVVRFWEKFIDYQNVIVTQAELYTLSSDSWREIPLIDEYLFIIRIHYVYNDDPLFTTFTNGFYHWLALGDGLAILSFDMANEVFSRSPLPDSVSHYCGRPRDYFGQLMVLNESLAIIFYRLVRIETPIEIWVMKEYGVKDSWTKQLIIESIARVERPLGFSKNGELLLRNSDKQLVLYNPETQESKNLPVCGLNSFQVICCVESLVPINGRPEHEDDAIIRTQSRTGDV